MADYLKLFHDRRLTVKEPHHLEYIKGRLANLRFEDPIKYKEYSEYYGIDIEVKVMKEPKTIEAKKDEKKVTTTSVKKTK